MSRTLRLTAILAFVCTALVAGCDDKVTIQAPEQENNPPIIFLLGPNFESNEIEVLDYEDVAYGPQLWCGIADEDEVPIVRLDVESVELTHMIVRPDSGTGCWRAYFADNVTIDVSSELPITLSGSSSFMYNGGSGAYSSDYGALSRTRLMHGSVTKLLDAFSDDWVKSCGSGPWGTYLRRVTVGPPIVAVEQDAFVTYLQLNVKGITVTAWDVTGKSSVAHYPDLVLKYTSDEERYFAP